MFLDFGILTVCSIFQRTILPVFSLILQSFTNMERNGSTLTCSLSKNFRSRLFGKCVFKIFYLVLEILDCLCSGFLLSNHRVWSTTGQSLHTSFNSFSKISWRGILHSCWLYSQAMKQHPFASTEIRSHLKTNNNFLHHTLCDNRHHMTRTKCEMEEAGPFQIIPYFMGGAPKLTLFVSTSNRNHGSACLLYCTTYVEHMYVVCT